MGLARRDVLRLAGVAGIAAVVAGVTQACGKPAVATPTVTTVPPPASTASPAPTPTVEPTKVPPSPATLAPRPSVGNERVRIAHLLRRAGFGASQQELTRYEKMGLAATVDYLVDYENVDDGALESRLGSLNLDLTKLPDLQRWWLLRMVYTRRPLQEKMVLFWHGVLTSGNSRVARPERMWKQNELFRQQALGRFDVLLKAVARDPAMLVWLDSQSNRKSAPNENFARELMELFSMGPGNYTEEDVRESARAFTGYFLNNQGFFFNTGQHDYGVKTFLGESGPFTGDNIIDIILKQAATPHFVCRKLFSFFAYETPEPEVLARLREALVNSGYSVKAAMKELLTSEAFYSEKSYRSQTKSPVELLVGTMRTLGVETDAIGLPQLLSRMGQSLFDPPNVAGWPGGAAWINSSTLLERVNFANRIAADRRIFKPLEALGGSGVRAPREITDYYVRLLLDGVVPAEENAIIYDYADSVVRTSDTDAALRSVAYLLLASPAYQLA